MIFIKKYFKISLLSLFLLSCMVSFNTQAQQLGNRSSILINNWESWVLLVVTLDKNKKPTTQANIDFSKPVKLSRKNGPEISIEEYFYEGNNGRLLKISCNNEVITQKFATTLQLKGWALEMTCKKEKYYFIIN